MAGAAGVRALVGEVSTPYTRICAQCPKSASCVFFCARQTVAIAALAGTGERGRVPAVKTLGLSTSHDRGTLGGSSDYCVEMLLVGFQDAIDDAGVYR